VIASTAKITKKQREIMRALFLPQKTSFLVFFSEPALFFCIFLILLSKLFFVLLFDIPWEKKQKERQLKTAFFSWILLPRSRYRFSVNFPPAMARYKSSQNFHSFWLGFPPEKNRISVLKLFGPSWHPISLCDTL